MRISRRKIVLALMGVSIAAVGFAAFIQVAPRIVWNGSASAPMGLYRIDERSARIGEFVLVTPSESAAALIAEREYLPPDTPLIKRIAAQTGDEVCRENERIFINKLHVSDAFLVDSMGRRMPIWGGCFTLKYDELFLLNAHEKSLDGRYFGATKRTQVIGVVIPVFVRE